MEGTQKLKKRIIILIILLFVFVAFFQNLSAQGYKIKVNIPLFKDSSIILGCKNLQCGSGEAPSRDLPVSG